MISRIHSWSYNGNRRYFLQIYVNSLFPGTAMLWNYMPIECFPLTFDLNGFKSRINKIESHLRTTAVPILEIKRCVRYKKKGHFGSSEGSVRRHWRPCFTALDNANSTGGLKGHSVPPSKGLGGKTAISYKRKKFFIRIPEMSHFSSKVFILVEKPYTKYQDWGTKSNTHLCPNKASTHDRQHTGVCDTRLDEITIQ